MPTCVAGELCWRYSDAPRLVLTIHFLSQQPNELLSHSGGFPLLLRRRRLTAWWTAVLLWSATNSSGQKNISRLSIGMKGSRSRLNFHFDRQPFKKNICFSSWLTDIYLSYGFYVAKSIKNKMIHGSVSVCVVWAKFHSFFQPESLAHYHYNDVIIAR